MKKKSSLKSAVEVLGFQNALIYDDFLVEKDNNVLLRSSSYSDDIYLYCHEGSKEVEQDAIVSRIIINGEYRGLRIKFAGLYNMVCKNEVDVVEYKDTVVPDAIFCDSELHLECMA